MSRAVPPFGELRPAFFMFTSGVGESYPFYQSRPAFWNNDPAHTVHALPLLPEDNYGTAAAINNLGQVIGWSGRNEPGQGNVGPGNPVLWQSGLVFDLQASLDSAWLPFTKYIRLRNPGSNGYGPDAFNRSCIAFAYMY